MPSRRLLYYPNSSYKTDDKHHHDQAHPHLKPNGRALIIGFGVLGVGVVILVVLLLILWYNHLKSSRTSPYDLTAVRLQRFTYRELKASTRSFNSTHRLGKGGFGVVYRGVLRNGKEIAVKRLDITSLQGEREFQNELSIIGGLRSPFVVSLLGYCADRTRRLLVYEHMQNRSLQEALFENDSPSKLDWETRFKIILDIAQALAFLHLECDPPIIHGDIKPSNVLLDARFSAKLADFGLARLKCDADFGPELFSQDLGRSQEFQCRSQDLWKSQDLGKSQDLNISQDFNISYDLYKNQDVGKMNRDNANTKTDALTMGREALGSSLVGRW